MTEVLGDGSASSPTITVRDIEVFPEGLSFTGTLARVSVEYSEGVSGPATFIAKMPDPRKAMPITASSYEREIRFYRELGNDVGVRVPEMYFGDSSGELAIILLEDLSPAETGDSTEGCTFDEAVVALQALARMHARWWNHPKILEADWLWSLESFGSGYEADIDVGWRNLPGQFVDGLAGELVEICATEGWFRDVTKLRPLGTHTLSHPDYRLDNLFFDHRGENIELTVIDWARVSRKRNGFDIAFFLADSGLSNEIISDCLEIYWQTLVAEGVQNLDWTQCLIEFQIGTLEVLGQMLWLSGSGKNVGTDQRIVEMRDRRTRRVLDIVEHFDSLSAIS